MAHQTSLIYWQNIRLSGTLFMITHHIKCFKIPNVQSRWFTDSRVMLSSCVESVSEEKSTEISVGQQHRGTLVGFFFFPQTVQQQKFQSISLSWSNQLLTETDNNIFVEVTRLFRQRMIYNLELYFKYSVRLPIRLMRHHQDEVVEGE